MSSRRAFRVAYDGTGYHGFQRQPDVPTVEDALLEGFRHHGVAPLEAGYAAAGRTDAGVSAAAQTIAVEVPDWLDHRALAGPLPDTIRPWASAMVPADFHPRHDAIERIYRYSMPEHGIDLERARRAAEALPGTHDFRDLSADTTDTVRELSALTLQPHGDYVLLEVRAPSFVRQQVRRLVTVVCQVGRGDRSLDDVERLLDPAVPIDGPEGVPPAPPEALVLWDVRYAGIELEADEPADAGTSFDRRARHHERIAGAMSLIADRVSDSGNQQG